MAENKDQGIVIEQKNQLFESGCFNQISVQFEQQNNSNRQHCNQQEPKQNQYIDIQGEKQELSQPNGQLIGCRDQPSSQLKDSHQQFDQSENDYQQLSRQLERALTKIKSVKKQQDSSFLNRVDYFQKKKQSDIKSLRMQRQNQQNQLYKKSSVLSIQSQKMLKYYEPIHERYQKIIEQKQKKIMRQQEDKYFRDQIEIQKQIQYRNKKVNNPRSKEEFLTSNDAWIKQKERKINEQIRSTFQKQMQGVTFTPQINSNSKRIVQNKEQVPIYQRPIKLKAIVDKQCSFRPNVTKTKK